jgi:hypothetical protein
LNEAVRIPGLLESLDQARQSAAGLSPDLVALAADELLHIYHRFDVAKSAFAAHLAGPLYYPPPAIEHDDATILFPGAFTAVTVIRYWTFRAICLMELRELSLTHPEIVRAKQTEDGPNLRPETLMADSTATVRNVYQSVPYLTHPKMNLFGPSTVLFPMRTTIEVLQAGGEAAKEDLGRCLGVLDSIQAKGYYFPSFEREPLYTRCELLDS